MTKNPDTDERQDKKFEWLMTMQHNEQSFFWTRFAGFAAINTGLMVLFSRSEGPTLEWVVLIAGLALSWAWVVVMFKSLDYIRKVKNHFHNMKKKSEYFPEIDRKSGLFSSTEAGFAVSVGAVCFWGVLGYLAYTN
ncbi:hypothetical protein GS624_03535 [Ruegeria sp. HKCCD5849]|uniref:hypothetical protein n=1 Tax=unclassified Ruegeria TaxID=2625375 RepID=UPI0014913E2E|nr:MULTISPECIES: hypothetical protein [unclassified Ruegeria]NOD46376.1 hypothetical protein [Ruegeria sp. HKCCD5849]NOD50324.1 hypothetical protein [Ruegeria sp. HKCCD5851]